MDQKLKTENSTEQNIPTTSEPIKEVSSILFILRSNLFYFLKGNTPISDTQQDEDDDETRKNITKKKKNEIDLPITPRLSGATKNELDRLIQHEVIQNFFLF